MKNLSKALLLRKLVVFIVILSISILPFSSAVFASENDGNPEDDSALTEEITSGETEDSDGAEDSEPELSEQQLEKDETAESSDEDSADEDVIDDFDGEFQFTPWEEPDIGNTEDNIDVETDIYEEAQEGGLLSDSIFYIEISAEDVTIKLGDTSFALNDGVSAKDEDGNLIAVTISDDDNFDAQTTGTYQISYQAQHPVTDLIYTAQRTVTVVDFLFDPQPENAEEVQALVDLLEPGLEGLLALPKWQFAIDDAWLPAGWAQSLFTDEESGVEYWRLVAGIVPLAQVFNGTDLQNEIDAIIASNADGEITFSPALSNTLELSQAIEINTSPSSPITITFKSDTPDIPFIIYSRNVYTGQLEVESTTPAQRAVRHFKIDAGNITLKFEGVVLDGGGTGGGIEIFEGSGDIGLDGVTIQNCKDYYAGGLRMKGGTVTITDSIITGNEGVNLSNALTLGANTGGGIYLTGGALSIENSQIDSNTARRGGGIGVENAQLTVTDSTINSNQTKQDSGFETGGGINISNGADVQISGGQISYNRADNTGGGINFTSLTTQPNPTITLLLDGVIMEANNAPSTAGIFIECGKTYGSTVTIRNSTITNHQARAISIQDSSGLSLFNTYITYNNGGGGSGIHSLRSEVAADKLYVQNNTSSSWGGGIHVEAGSLTLTDSFITDNTSSSSSSSGSFGGGIFCYSKAKLTLENTTIKDNTVRATGTNPAQGGGIWAQQSDANPTAPYVIIKDCTISDNKAIANNSDAAGGGLSLSGGWLEITGTTVSGNSLESPAGRSTIGGGLYIGKTASSDLKLYMTNCAITSNSAEYGGGISINNSTATTELKNITVSQNNATYGGGIYITGEGMTLTNDSTVSQNNAAQGGGIYTLATLLNLDDTQFTFNTATEKGGAIFGGKEEAGDILIRLEGVSIGPDVKFADNDAPIGYIMTDPADISTHIAMVNATVFTSPYQYAYNNLDVAYERGDPVRRTYTVTFDSQGGSSVPPVSGITPGTTIAEPSPPDRSGFEFTGWYQEPSCQNPWLFNTDTVTQNTVLYAKWTALSITPAQYAVTFHANGGNFLGNGSTYTLTFTEGQKIETTGLPSVTREGNYTFTGDWYTAPTGGEKWYLDIDMMPGNDLTLYANWHYSGESSGGNQGGGNGNGGNGNSEGGSSKEDKYPNDVIVEPESPVTHVSFTGSDVDNNELSIIAQILALIDGWDTPLGTLPKTGDPFSNSILFSGIGALLLIGLTGKKEH